MSGIRCGDFDGLDDQERKRELDKINFDWGDVSYYQHYRFVPMVLGLQVYRHLYGFAMPSTDFVVQIPHMAILDERYAFGGPCMCESSKK